MDVTARQRRTRASALRARVRQAKAMRRRARTTVRPAVRAAAVAAAGLTGAGLAGGDPPAIATPPGPAAAAVQTSGAPATCDPHTPQSQPVDMVSVGGTL